MKPCAIVDEAEEESEKGVWKIRENHQFLSNGTEGQ